MSSEEYRKLESRSFSRDNMDVCLKALAREYRRLNGTKMKAEIIIVGGASVVINYSFREMTTDIDAIICASSAMKDAVNHVGDRMGLPNGWFNTDFVRTDSYSDKLIQFQEDHPGVTSSENVNDILASLRTRKMQQDT